ncbi:uncharacterized protein LOC131679416 [Topomyia yanbarensis]|uniref:uncharacterized protein LOC131679416 n=1 Tax=Topomyia yanbarensis TaxID=2498891 RepID=UPI00273BE2C6|nr:uncharacterized protein LOC131679416 [Topomyia yanbarensis]
MSGKDKRSGSKRAGCNAPLTSNIVVTSSPSATAAAMTAIYTTATSATANLPTLRTMLAAVPIAGTTHIYQSSDLHRSAQITGTISKNSAAESQINTTPPGRSCKVCRGEDNNEMVQCDSCDKWYHYRCVGVGREVENEHVKWSCAKCNIAMALLVSNPTTYQLSTETGTQPQKLLIPSATQAQSRAPIITVTTATPKEDGTYVSNKSVDARPRGSANSSQASTSSRKSNRKLIALQLKQLEEQKLIETEFLNKKYHLMAEIIDEEGSVCSGDDIADKVSDWLHRTNLERTGQSIQSERRNATTPIASVNDVPRDSPRKEFDFESPNVCLLTRSQLAARQAVSKDLPSFDGNPEDWPVFVSSFNRTTEMCGFTNEENILRLQKSLKGRAYEAVRSQLLHSSNVMDVISTLKMICGQPEAIIYSIIGKVTAIPPVKAERLDTLVDFALAVRNLTTTITACNMEEYLYNITLLHQLVDKLPTLLKLEWGTHLQTIRHANLAVFNSWLYSKAEGASRVMAFRMSDYRLTTGVHKRGAILNAHQEDDSSEQSEEDWLSRKTVLPHQEVREPRSCPVCKGACTELSKCKRFLELTYDSKWATIKEFGYCRRCLRRHRGGCRSTKQESTAHQPQ